MNSAVFVNTLISEIPIDLFITRNRVGFSHGDLTFSNANGDLIFRLDEKSSRSSVYHLRDANGSSLISFSRSTNGWQGCIGDSKDFIFKVKKTFQSFSRRELEVFLVGDNSGDFTSFLKIRGSPFQRSCTIYQGNSIVAQTSLMYKLRKIITGRRRFRLTIFPGFINHAFLVVLAVIFFHGRI